ncbi:MAG: DUF4176 domain-containing protein [Bacilli bacterium]|nr:DUF4176 domain-containing protein [Bacilli bacterium]
MSEEKTEEIIETLETEEKPKDSDIPNKYLPIGSVVTLKNAIKSLMIIGYCPVTNNNELFDYCGVLVPEGLLESDKFIVFNHNVVEKLHFLGLQNEEQKKWENTVEEMAKNAINNSYTQENTSNNQNIEN